MQTIVDFFFFMGIIKNVISIIIFYIIIITELITIQQNYIYSNGIIRE